MVLASGSSRLALPKIEYLQCTGKGIFRSYSLVSDNAIRPRQHFPVEFLYIYVRAKIANNTQKFGWRCSGVIAYCILVHSVRPNMSSADCANCDCPDKTNCPKKQGFQLQEAVENRAYDMSFFSPQTAGMENDCKCGPNCQCTNCTCH